MSWRRRFHLSDHWSPPDEDHGHGLWLWVAIALVVGGVMVLAASAFAGPQS